MRIAFRVDASLEMGTGHVMRCLTLAHELLQRGAEVRFITRAHDGNLRDLIRERGYRVYLLPGPVLPETGAAALERNDEPAPAHARWLGCDWEVDATQSAAVLCAWQPDWLIVDHYALDHRWEKRLKPHCRRLMVIDDLADRPHVCDLLLDQTYGRDAQAYHPLVPDDSVLLLGARYALLRPEFAELRAPSLQRRRNPTLKRLLVTLGGVDKDNVTGQLLKALKDSNLPSDSRITVVMGATAPWLCAVRALAQELPWPTEVKVNVSDMAQLMAHSDLCIGAAGSTSWERCCLGLPTLMVVLAENQRMIAAELERAGAVKVISKYAGSENSLYRALKLILNDKGQLRRMSLAARQVTDGRGVDFVGECLFA